VTQGMHWRLNAPQGHKGLVGNCCRLLQDAGVRTLADWNRVNGQRLVRWVGSLRSYASIVAHAKHLGSEQQKVLTDALLTGSARIRPADRRRLTGGMLSDGLLAVTCEVGLYSCEPEAYRLKSTS